MLAELARSESDNRIDLAVGEPNFLRRALYAWYPETDGYACQPGYHTYPPPGGHQFLRERLATYISRFLDRQVTPDRVVVTTGAMQGLAAALFAVGRAGGQQVSARAPYFPYFPEIVRQSGLHWSGAYPLGPSDVELYAWPNNPTGMDRTLRSDAKRTRFRIWDAVYASYTYGLSDVSDTPEYDVGVGSASKEFALSGLRIGWAWFPSEEMAADAAEFVEHATAGTSFVSQLYLAEVISKALNPAGQDWLRTGQISAAKLLYESSFGFRGALDPYIAETAALPVDNGGMFAFFRPKDPPAFAAAVEAARVKLVHGPAFGLGGSDGRTWWRMNLGAYFEDLRRGIMAIANRLQ